MIQRRRVVSAQTRVVAMGTLGAVVLATAAVAGAAKAAGQGSVDPRFAPVITAQVGGNPARLVLTGTALRTKYRLSVYTIGSYLQEGVKVRDAEELARSTAPKLLHLIFERNVDGGTIADSFRDSISMVNPTTPFTAELDRLDRYFRARSARRGDHVWLTSIPGTGLAVQVGGEPVIVIANVAFARAAWEVYLGPRNLGAAIQMGLTSRL
jgi:hypothetical protein